MKIWEVKMYCGICSCQIWELGQPVPLVLVSLIGWLQWALVSLEGNLPIPGIPLLLENWKYMISIRFTSLSHNQEVRNHKPNWKTIFNNKCFQSCVTLMKSWMQDVSQECRASELELWLFYSSLFRWWHFL